MLKISLHIAGGTLRLLRRIALASSLLLALAAAGLILTLRYSVLPDIERYHVQIADSVSRATGQAVEIGKIEADWHGIGPHLRLSDIRILDKQQQTTLALKQVNVVVSWLTLLTGELRLASLEIDQPDLQVKRDVQGVLFISGIRLEEKSADNSFANMLLNQSRIVVRGARISWLDEKLAKPLLEFADVNLLIENVWNYHRFALRATPPASLSTQLDVRGDLYGKNFDELQGWSGEIFTQLDYADLAAWKIWLPLPESLKQGSGALRGWLDIEDGKISGLTADLGLVNVQTRLAPELPPLDIRVLSGRLGWRDLAQGFEVSMQNFSLKLFNDFVLKPTDALVRLSNLQEAETSTGEMRANLLELEGLGRLMEYLPVERGFKKQFAEFSPQGRVENLLLQWQFDTKQQLHYKVKGRFNELSLQRVGKLPGFSGLSGEVNGSESGGTMSINSHDLKLDAPQLMPGPVAFDSVSGQSSWQIDSGELEVKLRNVALSNADISGNAYGSYQTLADSAGKIDLTVHLTRAAISNVGKYIPLIGLGAETRKWINQSLLDGQSSDFNLRLKGNLNNFPFVANKNGIFKINARAKGVSLEIGEGWPRIDNANIDLLIQGKELSVSASSAMTAGIPLKNVRVAIYDLLSNDLMLHVRGEAEAENARALGYIDSSPVRGYLDGFTDDIKASGKGRLTLKLDLPLKGEQQAKVAGSYHFMDSELDFDKNLPTARKVNGDLMFTESGVSTKNIIGNILGGQANLEIDSSPDGAMKIRLGGRANLDALRQINPHPVLSKLSGNPAWKVEVGVQNKLRKVLLTTTLKGLQSDLPVPFSKQADESINLRFEMNDLSLVRQSMAMQYGTLINSNFLNRKNRDGSWSLERGALHFGNELPRMGRTGLWITGSLPQLSVEGWGLLAGALGGDENSAPIRIGGTDLLIQQLNGYGYNLDNLHIRASTRNAILTAQLAARDLNGELSWQGGDGQFGEHGRLIARLKNLDLVKAVSAGSSIVDEPQAELQAGTGTAVELPMIDLAIDRLSLQGRQLGRLDLLAQHHDRDYQLDRFQLSNPDGVLKVDGKWQMSTDTAESRVNLVLDIYNAGNMLARFGYPDSVKNGSGILEATFAWPGAPASYSKHSLNGQISLDTGKGQFLQIDPGAGKLLSILSLQALPKRIALDFEDVFSKGFEFDKITGTADVKQGVIFTDNLKIDGSSAKVTMTGQMNLVDETQNLRVRIVPAVGNSVALISALVATPVVGAGVYLAGKILNDPLGQLVSFEYNITGSWVDPKVEKILRKKPDETPEN